MIIGPLGLAIPLFVQWSYLPRLHLILTRLPPTLPRRLFLPLPFRHRIPLPKLPIPPGLLQRHHLGSQNLPRLRLCCRRGHQHLAPLLGRHAPLGQPVGLRLPIEQLPLLQLGSRRRLRVLPVLVVVVVAVSLIPLVRHRFSCSSSPHEGAGTEPLDCADGARDSPISHGKPRKLPGCDRRPPRQSDARDNPSSPRLHRGSPRSSPSPAAAKPCGELTRGASDREIRGSEGSPPRR
uniref:Uncharacterized protein n=1 Tax=Arundo donax TaxID=35708 RepID=A0A0A9E704_ARUDO